MNIKRFTSSLFGLGLVAIMLFTAVTPVYAAAGTITNMTVDAQSGVPTYGTSGNGSYAVHVTTNGSFKGNVSIQAAGLPTGATQTGAALNIRNATTVTVTVKITTSVTTPAGVRDITVQAKQNGRTRPITTKPATFTVDALALHVNGELIKNKVYDNTTDASYNPACSISITTNCYHLDFVKNGDVVSLNLGSTVPHFNDKNVGTGKAVTVPNLGLAQPAANYTLVQPNPIADITPAAANVTGPTKTVPTSFIGEPNWDPQITGLYGSDTLPGLTCNDFEDSAGTTALPDPATPTSPYPVDPGSYFVVCSGASNPNYGVTYEAGDLLVTSSGAPQLATTSVNFGTQLLGTKSAIKSVQLKNNGSVALQLFSVAVNGAQYSIIKSGTNSCYVSNVLKTSIGAGASCNVYVQFFPGTPGVFNGSLTVVSDDANSPAHPSLSGSGIAGQQRLKNASFEFDANHNSVPDYWNKNANWNAADGRDCTVHYAGTGNCSLKLVANGKLLTATQTLLVNSGPVGRGFRFYLRSKALAVPTSAVYNVRVTLKKGTTVVYSKVVSFSKGTHGFTQVSGSFSAPAVFDRVVFQITYKASSGTVWFDPASLKW